MLIPITADPDPALPDGVRQWAMIELQGEVERKDGGSLEEAFDVGTLSVPTSVSHRWHALAGGAGLAHSCWLWRGPARRQTGGMLLPPE